MKLVVFDLDGTLTRTSAVDVECYARSLVDTLRFEFVDTDWSRYEHVTDEGILTQLFMEHFGREAAAGAVTRGARGSRRRAEASRGPWRPPGAWRAPGGSRACCQRS